MSTSPSRRTRTSSSSRRSRPCSAAGITRARTSTASMNEIPYEWGTAVNVQQMAFGNSGDTFRHGRGLHAQPRHGREAALSASTSSTRRARTSSPACVRRVRSATCRIRCRRCTTSSSPSPTGSSTIISDMQDMEFTIEDGKLYMLQTRNGKRTAAGRAEDRRATSWTRA